MNRLPLDEVQEQLLREGIPPRQVRRYITELREHLTDLERRERSTGLGDSEAEARARAILGTDTQLVQAMLERSPPRSLAAKAPWAVFGVVPLVLLFVSVALLARIAMAFLFPYSASAVDIPDNIRTLGSTLAFIGSHVPGPALAVACIVIALRQRLSSRWIWIGLALIALASAVLGLDIQFPTPGTGVTGGMRGSAVRLVYEHGQVDVAATLAWMGVRAAALFVLSALAYHLFRQRIDAAHA